MDALTFLSTTMKTYADMLAAFAWPVAVCGIAYFFREDVRSLLKVLKSLKLPGGMSADFDRDMREAAAQAKEIAAPAPELDAGSDPADTMDDLAATAHPTGVVMETWKSIETLLKLLFFRWKGPEGIRYQFRSTATVLRQLTEAGILSEKETNFFQELRNLRNLVAHDPSARLNEAQAKEYFFLAQKMQRVLISKANAFDPSGSSSVPNGGIRIGPPELGHIPEQK